MQYYVNGQTVHATYAYKIARTNAYLAGIAYEDFEPVWCAAPRSEEARELLWDFNVEIVL